MTQDSILYDFLDSERIRLGVGGFYPTRLKRTFAINFMTVFSYFITFAQIGAVSNFVLSTTDITKISEIFLFSMTQVGFVNKLLNFHQKSYKIDELDETLQMELFTKMKENEKDIFRKAFKNCQRVLNLFITICFGVVLLYGVVPLMDNKEGLKNYPFPGKFPFNPDNYYALIYGGEVCAVAVSAWNNSTLDCLFAKHTVIATTMFKILCEKIVNLLDYDEKILSEKIKHCVIYYNEIIRYVSKIEKIFSYGILIQFFCSAVVICLTGFQLLVVSSKSGQSSLLIVYLSCMTFQLVLYCWYGHMLMEKSNDITKACYVINWHEMNVKHQKMLITIMERAKKPVNLNAAGIFRLNMGTLMTILRSSYSYFAVLQQIYKK